MPCNLIVSFSVHKYFGVEKGLMLLYESDNQGFTFDFSSLLFFMFILL